MYIFVEKYGKLSQIYSCYSFLSRALFLIHSLRTSKLSGVAVVFLFEVYSLVCLLGGLLCVYFQPSHNHLRGRPRQHFLRLHHNLLLQHHPQGPLLPMGPLPHLVFWVVYLLHCLICMLPSSLFY